MSLKLVKHGFDSFNLFICIISVFLDLYHQINSLMFAQLGVISVDFSRHFATVGRFGHTRGPQMGAKTRSGSVH